MGAKITTVRLTALDCYRTDVFALEVAERLLMAKRPSWRIADGEKVEFTGNGFRSKPNTEGDKNSVKERADKRGDKATGVD